MPAFNTIGPASTPQRYLDNQYKLLQQQTQDWEKNLRSQGLDENAYAEEIGKMQKQLNTQISAFQAKTEELRQTQSMVDLGIISDPAQGEEAMWAAVLPKEVKDAIYPQQPEVSKREPFSLEEMKKFKPSVEQFAKETPRTRTKQYGVGGYDWTKRDIKTRSQASIMQQYKAWKQFIGYEGLTPVEKRQVDGEWDMWLENKGESWKWDASSKYIRAERAGGPITRAYGSKFRKTPTGPNEAVTPLQMSIAQALPKKKKQPTAEELLQNRTEENYELGKSLGYWK